MIQALDNNTADCVKNIILDPPENPYNAIKAALVKAFGRTQAEEDQELLNLNGLGDKKPSELLQHMKNLNADPNTLFKALFLAQLPSDVRRILTTSSKTDIIELASEDVQVNATGTSRGPPQQSQLGQNHTGPSRSGRQMLKIPSLCKYHSTFGDKAKKCVPPCKFDNA